MATNWSVCAVCDALNETKPSIVWCSECDHGLCSDCDRRHGIPSATKGHQTVPIENYGKLPLTILQTSQTCPEHNKSYQKYCTKHESLCCIDCIIHAHKGCPNIQNSDDVVDNIKKSHLLLECEETLENIKKNIKEAIKNRDANAASLKAEREKIESEVKSIRQKVNAHLDKVEHELIKELNDSEERESMKIRSFLIELQQKQTHIEELKTNIESLKKHASNVQLFLAMKDIEKETNVEENYVKSLFNKAALNAVSMSFKNTETNVESLIRNIGKMQVLSNPPLSKYIERQQKHAQIVIPKRLVRVEDIRLNLVKKLNVYSPANYGCTFLDENRYVIASYHNDSVTVMKPDGSEDFRIKFKPYKVNDIVHVPSLKRIAATTDKDSKHYITVIDLNKRKITRSIPVDTNNHGITLHGDKLVYCAKGRKLMLMDIKDNSIKSIDIKSMSGPAYVASYRDNLYYTNGGDNTVTCCDINGKIKWQFKDEDVLSYPHGICVDGDGFVYVVGFGSHNVVVISPDGLHYNVLLGSQDGLDWPHAIDYDRKNDVLLVVNEDNDAFVYYVKK